MCGIFASVNSSLSSEDLEYYFNRIQHRGPSSSEFINVKNNVHLGFHRLAINGEYQHIFEEDGCYMVSNAEIYNYLDLAKTFGIELTTGSDCEIILKLYLKYRNIETVLQLLDGEFAFVIYDSKSNEMYAARDPFGVRPLFVGINHSSQEVYFASEMKAIPHSPVKQLESGHYISITKYMNLHLESLVEIKFKNFILRKNKYYEHEYSYESDILLKNRNIRKLLQTAVEKRLMSDVPIGTLLSGGLDSSLVTAINLEYVDELHVFTIGMKGSPDIKAAKKVVSFLKNKYSTKNCCFKTDTKKIIHHIIHFTLEDAIKVIPNVIYHLETYDITTIRASVPQYILAKYIKENTNVRVILSGEGSDELFNGYAYSRLAPNSDELRKDTEKLLSELYLYDNLRTDRTMAAFGLEVRLPFLDFGLVDFVINLDPNYKMSNDKIEKKLLRDSFVGYLPHEILWRPKAAFSDAVGSNWIVELKKYFEEIIDESELIFGLSSKEATFYKCIFDLHFNGNSDVLPHYWMPNWCPTITDPSARYI